ncbi:hypothetical protein OROMI_032029 [Orobanche minor]
MEQHSVAVIMVPFPAQGHLNQLLQLSCLISSSSSSSNFPVHYVSSPIFIRQAISRANNLNPQHIQNIHFHEIPTPHFDSPSPDPNSPSKFPTQLQPAWYASLNLREPFFAFLRDMSGKFKRVVVIHDPLMAVVVQDVTSIPNAESYVFNCISACSQVSFARQELQKLASVEFPKELPTFEGCVPDDVWYFVEIQSEPLDYRSGDLYNTCRLIEAPYLDILEHKETAGKNRKRWAIGPILPIEISPTDCESRHECLGWLDKHDPNSVIYISFGSTVSLQDEQIKELAMGLEQSKVKFLWVLRDADKGNVFEGQIRRAELPEGFEERVEGSGMVVRDWAPQPQILAHASTGGFMSHCGWNSCLESITMGVPMAAWPMHSDQPVNTVLVTEVLRVGIVAREWKQRMELVRASSIESCVKRLMGSEEGNEIRNRVEEMAIVVRRATQEGGASRVEMDSFIAHISR